MSLFSDLRKGLKPLPWSVRGELSLIRADAFLKRDTSGAPVFVDLTGVRMEEEDEIELGKECILPPFQDAWLEWRDQGTYDEVGRRLEQHEQSTIGVRAMSISQAEWQLVVSHSWTQDQVRDYISLEDYISPEGASDIPTHIKISAYLRQNKTPRVVTHLGESYIVGDHSGRLITTEICDKKHFLRASIVDPTCGKDDAATRNEWLGIASSCVIDAYTLLNCRNVVLSPVQAERKTGKHGKRGLEWHRLVVLAPSEVRRYPDKAVPFGVGEPFVGAHLCRGHFKEFSNEKPLFGKITGRWWWGAHSRGDKDRGVVLKDYSVKAPK